MRNLNEKKKELSFKKFQVSKIINPQYIFGGNRNGNTEGNDKTTHGQTQRPNQN